jgi:predicted Zn-dependent peptidase
MNTRNLRVWAVFFWILLPLRSSNAQDLTAFEKITSVHTLSNGMTVLLVERHNAPVFSFFTLVDVGAVQEEPGQTGLAHMFEHMAFKGTQKIGVIDAQAESKVLEKIEASYLAYDEERRKVVGRDDKRVEEMEKAWRNTIKEGEAFVIKNEFGEIVERNGGTELNAGTSYEETVYLYSLPSNRLELWAYLESERFLKPVMREFYTERDVVVEERRMRTDSSPIGRLVEQFLATAFSAHPYGRPVVGWPSDLETFSATDARRFFEKYYVPANMTLTLVGDIKAAEALPVIERYFGRLPSAPKPPPLATTEPRQFVERQVIMKDASQPFYIEGYHRPDSRHPDNAIYEAISDILSSGRTSRLYRALVRDQKIAVEAAGFSGFPGIKYPHLFAFYGIPGTGHTSAEIRNAIHGQIERLKQEEVTDQELRQVKARAKASLIRGMNSNLGLAQSLGTAMVRFGDWREIFRQVERIEKVSKEDIRRIAKQVFLENNRTAAWIENDNPKTDS